MASFPALVKGLSIGAAAMYFFDPLVGRRRRSLARDQVNLLSHEIHDFLDKGVRDLENKTKGLAAEIGHSLAGTPASSDVLAERVRSAMGRYVANPHAIEVSVHDGRVVLKGAIRSDEVQPFVNAVANVRGVHQVENELDVRQLPTDDNRSGQPRRSRLQYHNWSPGGRLLATAAGGGLMLNCMAKRTPSAILLGTLGFGLFLRATANRPLQQWFEEMSQPQPTRSQQHTNRMMAEA